MSKKNSEAIHLFVTYEMGIWLKQLAAASGTTRSTVIRSMLQAIMDDDLRANVQPLEHEHRAAS